MSYPNHVAPWGPTPTSSAPPREPAGPWNGTQDRTRRGEDIPASDWLVAVRVPSVHPGRGQLRLHLPHPTRLAIVNAAIRACVSHHRHGCGVCRVLIPLYALAAVAAVVLTVVTTLAAATTSVAQPPAPMVLGVYAALALASAAAARHRRRLPLELSLRITNETRPHGMLTTRATAVNPQPV